MTDLAKIQLAMKDGLRRLAKAVVVITCEADGQRFAMAATAVSELSLDPPSMLICVNKSASIFAPLAKGADFCINILEGSQADISAACSGKLKGEDRFGVGSWRKSDRLDIPCLEDAQASFVCENETSLVHGTHGVFIGRVIEVTTAGSVNPLIYLDGRYLEPGSASASV